MPAAIVEHASFVGTENRCDEATLANLGLTGVNLLLPWHSLRSFSRASRAAGRPDDVACKSSIHAMRKHNYARGAAEAMPCATRSAVLRVKMAEEIRHRNREKRND